MRHLNYWAFDEKMELNGRFQASKLGKAAVHFFNDDEKHHLSDHKTQNTHLKAQRMFAYSSEDDC